MNGAIDVTCIETRAPHNTVLVEDCRTKNNGLHPFTIECDAICQFTYFHNNNIRPKVEAELFMESNKR